MAILSILDKLEAAADIRMLAKVDAEFIRLHKKEFRGRKFLNLTLSSKVRVMQAHPSRKQRVNAGMNDGKAHVVALDIVVKQHVTWQIVEVKKRFRLYELVPSKKVHTVQKSSRRVEAKAVGF